MKKIFVLLLICLVATACQTKHRGYVFPTNIEQEITKVHTTAQLKKVVGDPQAKTMYGDEVWIYYGSDENMRGPFPVKYDNKTVVLAWVKGNNVVKTKVLHDEDLEKVKMASGETEIPAAIELYAIEELFNNIGRFSPSGMAQ